MSLIFVYGTLKKGGRLSSALSGTTYLGEDFLPGYEMFNLGWYPGIREGEGVGRVEGELYEVDPATLFHLDRIEGHPGLFRRTPVVLESGHDAETYVYQHEGGVLIPEGRWEVEERKEA